MDRRRLVWIGVAAVAVGGVLSWLAYQSLLTRMSTAAVGVNVLVAANDIKPGSRIDDQDLRVAKYPAELLPRDVLHSRDRAVGHGALVAIDKGEFVLPYKLSATPGPISLIPPGKRAIRVRVNEFESDFFRPDSRVDVLFTGNAEGSKNPQTRFLLQDVPVLPNSTRMDSVNPTGEGQKTSVVTLLVTPEQAEQLTSASYEGHIKLVLRSPHDTAQEETPPVMSSTGGKRTPQRASSQRAPVSPAGPFPTKICPVVILRGNRSETVQKECGEGS